uniref:Uncharacterized protein n=1 Tax=Rhizophora mucronata TaxID=61149 RepID=A0A2P2NC22_RHIMU
MSMERRDLPVPVAPITTKTFSFCHCRVSISILSPPPFAGILNTCDC